MVFFGPIEIFSFGFGFFVKRNHVTVQEKALSVNSIPIRFDSERWRHIVENHVELAGHFYDVLSRPFLGPKSLDISTIFAV